MTCPLKIGEQDGTRRNGNLITNQCILTECAWYCKGEECCSIKVLALEAIKRGE